MRRQDTRSSRSGVALCLVCVGRSGKAATLQSQTTESCKEQANPTLQYGAQQFFMMGSKWQNEAHVRSVRSKIVSADSNDGSGVKRHQKTQILGLALRVVSEFLAPYRVSSPYVPKWFPRAVVVGNHGRRVCCPV